MTRKKESIAPRRRLLRPLLWGLPFLLLPCGVLFVETWMNLKLLAADYRTMRLRTEINAYRERIQELRAQEAELGHNMATLELQAAALGLRAPTREQLVILPEDQHTEDPSALDILDLQFAQETETDREGPQ